MFIQTEATPNPAQMKFLPGQPVMPTGAAYFPNEITAERSPLAQRLFAIEGVASISLDKDSITVTKADTWDWQALKTLALAAIMNHYTAGDEVILEECLEGEKESAEEYERAMRKYNFSDDILRVLNGQLDEIKHTLKAVSSLKDLETY